MNTKRLCRVYTKKKPCKHIAHKAFTLNEKEGGLLLSRIAVQYHRRKWA